MSSGFSSINPNVFKFIFHEDLYLVKDQEMPNTIAPAATQTKKAEETVTTVKPEPVKELPKEIKKVAVVAGTEKEITLYQEFLSKILQAVGVSWEEAGFIAFDKTSNYDFQTYLIFGIENQKLVNFKSPIFLNQVQVEGKEKYIFTYSLNDLEKNKDKKKGLWAAMQAAFLTNK